ncbi:hypothetical protein Leryth_015252 [Lithospermum erythrorhizon]|nr:hypothetical protein Leryth_015252 [Lithospermum erythrorhizon]
MSGLAGFGKIFSRRSSEENRNDSFTLKARQIHKKRFTEHRYISKDASHGTQRHQDPYPSPCSSGEQRFSEGSIPLSLWDLKDLLALSLTWNEMNGSLPVEVGNMKALSEINLSGNRFSGNFPSALGNLDILQGLALRNNSFEGQIPESISKMISLEDLDLSNNNLSGSLPRSLTTLLHLTYFDV